MSKTPSSRPHPIRMFFQVVKQVGGHYIITAYLVFLLVCAAVFCVVEPDTFSSFGNALWYEFEMITTIGFGDIVAQTMFARVLSMVIGLSALLVVGLITGIVVSYFNEMMRAQQNESMVSFGHKLEHLTELSDEELADLQNQYRTFKHHRTGK